MVLTYKIYHYLLFFAYRLGHKQKTRYFYFLLIHVKVYIIKTYNSSVFKKYYLVVPITNKIVLVINYIMKNI